MRKEVRPFTRPILLAAPLLLLPCAAARTQEEGRRPVEVTEGAVGISFDPPPGCVRLPEETLAAIIKQGGAPLKYGCASRQRDVLAFVLMVASGGKGEKGMADFEKGFRDSQKQAHPEVEWLGREVLKSNGVEWVRLSFRESPSDSALRDEVYIADWAGQFIVFTFSTPSSRYAARGADFEKSLKSVVLELEVIAPVVKESPAKGQRRKIKH